MSKNNTLDEIIQLLDSYHRGGEFHHYTPLEKQRHAKQIQALITEAKIEFAKEATDELDSLTHYIRSLFRDGYPTATKEDEREMFVKEDVIEMLARLKQLKEDKK